MQVGGASGVESGRKRWLLAVRVVLAAWCLAVVIAHRWLLCWRRSVRKRERDRRGRAAEQGGSGVRRGDCARREGRCPSGRVASVRLTLLERERSV